MMPQLPLIVLGGSDRSPSAATAAPAAPNGRHPLSGYKAADIEILGRPMVHVVLDRARASGAFAPVYLAGPERVYGRVVAPDTLIDTDGSFGHNIQTSLETVRRRHPGSPVAFLTSDVAPEVDTLRRLAALYAASAPCDLWAPMVRVRPDERPLGASAWKPRYRIVFEPGSPALEALPGHLVVVDPDAINLDLAYKVFQIAYSTRNRPIATRRNAMVRALALGLVAQDLRNLLTLRPPTLTWTVMRAGVVAAGELRRGTITVARLERALRILFVRRRHRRRFPARRVVVPLVDDLSLAMDVDTEEEAEELAARLAAQGPARPSGKA